MHIGMSFNTCSSLSTAIDSASGKRVGEIYILASSSVEFENQCWRAKETHALADLQKTHEHNAIGLVGWGGERRRTLPPYLCQREQSD